jgi:hypothetical protein
MNQELTYTSLATFGSLFWSHPLQAQVLVSIIQKQHVTLFTFKAVMSACSHENPISTHAS